MSTYQRRGSALLDDLGARLLRVVLRGDGRQLVEIHDWERVRLPRKSPL